MPNILLPKQPDPGPGQLPVLAFWLGYSTGGLPLQLTTAAGFTAEEVTLSRVPYPTTWLVGDVQLVYAWDDVITRIITLFPTALIHLGVDDGQLITWSDGTSVVPNRRAYECEVTGKLEPRWAGKRVTGELRQSVIQHGQVYTKLGFQSNPVTAEGYWTMPGCPRNQFMTFIMPDLATKFIRYVPDEMAMAFDALPVTSTP